MSLNPKNVTVGTTAVQLDSTGQYNNIQDKILTFKARVTNTGSIFIGNINTITTSTTNTCQLQAGEQIVLQRNDFTALWAIASSAGQILDIIPFNN
jgi:hypothetical protein